MDEGSYIIKPKDPSAIVRLQDPTVIQQLLEQPLTVIAESLAGYFSVGNGFWAAAGTRLAQAALKGRVFQQFERELRYLRDKGKIPDDFPEKKLGYQSWVELLTILDEELPDEDRLKALKAMFYAVNKVGTTDAQKILAYQLFRISAKLTSGELLLLRAVFDAYGTGTFAKSERVTLSGWATDMSNRLGHGLSALVVKDQNALVEQGLISPRIDVATGAHQLQQQWVDMLHARITDLGIRFCENVKTYQTDLADAGQTK